jgi:hypothetical protein
MDAARSQMIVDLQPGDAVQVGDVTMELVHKSGRAARLRLIAPRQVPIERRPATDAPQPVPGMAQYQSG